MSFCSWKMRIFSLKLSVSRSISCIETNWKTQIALLSHLIVFTELYILFDVCACVYEFFANFLKKKTFFHGLFLNSSFAPILVFQIEIRCLNYRERNRKSIKQTVKNTLGEMTAFCNDNLSCLQYKVCAMGANLYSSSAHTCSIPHNKSFVLISKHVVQFQRY